jgi:hypothetical protein
VLVAGGISQCCDSGGTSAEVYSSALVDTLPPTITTPGDFSVVAPDAGGTSVSYSVSVTDNVDGNPQLDCQPPSGSTFQLGATTVQCTASDAAGNTAAASFIVTVLPPLDIALLPDRFGGVIPRTGVASVRGSASCNRATHVFVSGELKETVANRGVVDGFYFTEFDCSPPSATWEATVVPTAGSYGAGKATVTGSAFSCDQYFSCDFDQKSAVITLRGR